MMERRLIQGDPSVPGGLKTLLEQGSADLPSQGDLQQLALKLSGSLGMPVSSLTGEPNQIPRPGEPAPQPADPGMGTSSAASATGGAKLLGALAVGALLAGGLIAYLTMGHDSSDSAQSDTKAVPDAVLSAPMAEPADPGAESAPHEDPSGAQPQTGSDASTDQPSAPSAKAAEPAVSATPQATAKKKEFVREPKAPPPSNAKAPPPSEAQLLSRAHAALSKDPRLALKLTAQHRKLYPGGALAQEREIIEIDAMKRLGKLEQAQERKQQFEQDFSGSPYRRKLETTPR